MCRQKCQGAESIEESEQVHPGTQVAKKESSRKRTSEGGGGEEEENPSREIRGIYKKKSRKPTKKINPQVDINLKHTKEM